MTISVDLDMPDLDSEYLFRILPACYISQTGCVAAKMGHCDQLVRSVPFDRLCLQFSHKLET